MLKIDREAKALTQLETPSLAEADILERTDLQEYIFNSSADFFAELEESIFLIGKEVVPSQTVADRIDLLGIDAEGAAVVIELKRGSKNKLQMLQAVSYAGMVARWGQDDFRRLIPSDDRWEQLAEFLEVELEEVNRQQRLLLVAEGYDYALLSGSEWLSDEYGVDIRCCSVKVARDAASEAEYLACTSIFPPPEMAEQATARNRSSSERPARWSDWEEALEEIENEALEAFARGEVESGRKTYLKKRGIDYRLGGRRRWRFHCRRQHAYVWQSGRFREDAAFWQSLVSNPGSVESVKDGAALRFRLRTKEDFQAFRDAATTELVDQDWFDSEPE